MHITEAVFDAFLEENDKYYGNWTFRSQENSLPGAKVPGVELSLLGTFVP